MRMSEVGDEFYTAIPIILLPTLHSMQTHVLLACVVILQVTYKLNLLSSSLKQFTCLSTNPLFHCGVVHDDLGGPLGPNLALLACNFPEVQNA